MLNGTGYEGTRASGSCTTITNSFKVMILKAKMVYERLCVEKQTKDSKAEENKDYAAC